MLPAGVWLLAGHWVLLLNRTLLRSGIPWRWGMWRLMRLSAWLSRVGFNSWRYNKGKWR